MNGWSGPLPNKALLAEWRALLGEPRPIGFAVGRYSIVRIEVGVHRRVRPPLSDPPLPLLSDLFPEGRRERREFAFLCLDVPPTYRYITLPANLRPTPSQGPMMPADPFAPIEEAMSQSEAWKSAHGFPVEIEALCRFDRRMPRWSSVPIVRWEELAIAWAKRDNEWAAFALQPDTRELIGTSPLFTIPADAPGAPLELLNEG